MAEMKSTILAFDVEEYVEDYEFRGDEGAYQPTEQERLLITDALHGAMSELSLAASPQAPAREGVDGAAMGRLMAVLSSDYLRGPAPIPGLGAVSWDDLRAIAALTPREEAPADNEPVFHRNLLSHEDNEAWSRLSEEAPAEGAGDARELAVLLDNLVIAQSLSRDLREAATDQARSYLYDLRNRTSEPEAGEASAYRVRRVKDDSDEWTLMHPEVALDFMARSGWEAQPLYTHPSPATADKLREVLTPFAQMADKFGCWSVVEVCAPDPDNPSPVIQPIRLSAFENAAALLATLSPKEEGGE